MLTTWFFEVSSWQLRLEQRSEQVGWEAFLLGKGSDHCRGRKGRRFGFLLPIPVSRDFDYRPSHRKCMLFDIECNFADATRWWRKSETSGASSISWIYIKTEGLGKLLSRNLSFALFHVLPVLFFLYDVRCHLPFGRYVIVRKVQRPLFTCDGSSSLSDLSLLFTTTTVACPACFFVYWTLPPLCWSL